MWTWLGANSMRTVSYGRRPLPLCQLVNRLKKKGILRKREPTDEKPADSDTEGEDEEDEEQLRQVLMRTQNHACRSWHLTCLSLVQNLMRIAVAAEEDVAAEAGRE